MTSFARYISMLVAVGIGLSLMTGCGTESSARASDSPGSAASSSQVDREQLRKLYSGMSSRYLEVEETEDLAGLDTTGLALVGEVAGYEDGPISIDGVPRVLLKVQPTDVFDGQVGDDGLVEVMLEFGDQSAKTILADALPAGSPLALYLNPTVETPDSFGDLYVPVSPQGFVTEDADGSIFPMDAELDTEEPLEEQVPEDVEVP